MLKDNIEQKIIASISVETGIPDNEVEKAIDLFFTGCRNIVAKDEPAHIRMPFLGVLEPKKDCLKKYEVNNT